MDKLNLDALLPRTPVQIQDSDEARMEAMEKLFAHTIEEYEKLASVKGHGHQNGNEGMIVFFEALREDGTIVGDAIPLVYDNNELAEEGLNEHRELMMSMVSSRHPDQITGRISIINQYKH